MYGCITSWREINKMIFYAWRYRPIRDGRRLHIYAPCGTHLCSSQLRTFLLLAVDELSAKQGFLVMKCFENKLTVYARPESLYLIY